MKDIYPVAVPKWGIEMVEGTVTTWNRREGEAVARGDEVFEMESDKIVNVWESPVDGVLRRVLAQEGDTHPVGALLAVIAPPEVEDATVDAFIASYGKGEGEPASAARKAETPASRAGGAQDANTRSSPTVRSLARELGVDLNTVTGSGRRGRITEDDVRAAASGGATQSSSAVEISPLSATRRTIARRLTEAKQQIPHFYLEAEYELDGLLAHRERLNAGGGEAVSVNDLLVWCVGRALMREPRVNVNLVGDEVHRFRDANVAVAIATDEGLYPATLRAVQDLTPAQVARGLAALAERARAGALTREDITGGSFTVSNLGMYGVHRFTAIVNPPMGAILALGRAREQMVVREGAPAVAMVIAATLSCDHRVIDGAVGAAFLQTLGEEIAALD